MARYDADIKACLAAIKEDGQLVEWQQVPVVIADATQEWKKTSGVPVLTPVTIAFVTGSSAFTRLLPGSNVGTGGIRGLMGAVSFMPQLKDTVIRPFQGSDVTLSINSIDIVAPNGQVILYKIEFKQ